MDSTDLIQGMASSCGQGGNILVIWLVGNFLSSCATIGNRPPWLKAA
jgi:hypothetical protein